MVERGTPGSVDNFHTDLFGEFLVEKITAAHLTVQDIGRPFRWERFILLHQNSRFSHEKRVALR